MPILEPDPDPDSKSYANPNLSPSLNANLKPKLNLIQTVCLNKSLPESINIHCKMPTHRNPNTTDLPPGCPLAFTDSLLWAYPNPNPNPKPSPTASAGPISAYSDINYANAPISNPHPLEDMRLYNPNPNPNRRCTPP